ncbi:hypothetical protein EV361DRAFT_884772 [Lentinula raphanica]|nr:hypothetical protein EV361DRAFT_884772 [Lentinula raphanica]
MTLSKISLSLIFFTITLVRAATFLVQDETQSILLKSSKAEIKVPVVSAGWSDSARTRRYEDRIRTKCLPQNRHS